MGQELTYIRGKADPAALEEDARVVWDDLFGTPEFDVVVEGAGAKATDVPNAFPFEIREASAGIVVSGTTIAIGILSPIAKDVGVDIWRKLILPHLEKRWGKDAIGPEKKNDDDKADPKN